MALATGRPLRILVLTHAFPPLNAIGSHRPYGWARAWRHLGHQVVVVTPCKYAFDGALDLQRDLERIEVHEVPYAGRGESPGTAGGTPAFVHRWEGLKVLTRRARLALGTFGEPRWLAYRPMLSRAQALAREQPFDFAIATAPPDVSLFVARSFSRRTGTPWVADYRDLWFRELLLYRSRLASALAGPLNRWLVGDASMLVAISQGLQERLSAYLGRDVLLSRNGFLEEDHRDARPRSEDGRRHLVYTGRVYPGRQDPQPLLRALARLQSETPRLREHLAVDFYGYDDPALRRAITQHGLDSCAGLRGFVPYRESMAVQCAADALLFLDWTDSAGEGMMTGKLLEYVGSRRPILAIGSRGDSEASRLIADTGAGTTLTSDGEILEYLRDLIASPRRPDVHAQRVERYSRERQARELLEAIVARLPGLQPRR